MQRLFDVIGLGISAILCEFIESKSVLHLTAVEAAIGRLIGVGVSKFSWLIGLNAIGAGVSATLFEFLEYNFVFHFVLVRAIQQEYLRLMHGSNFNNCRSR